MPCHRPISPILPATLLIALLALSACAASGSSTDGAHDGGQPPACTENAHCNDNNPCTDDLCSPAGQCDNAPNTAPCDDGNSCTQGDTCGDGVCNGGDNTCACNATPDCAAFDDSDKCNGTLICSDNVCVPDPATVINCPTADDTECRKNECQPASGACVMTNVSPGTACSDGDACTAGDTCQAGTCRGGSEVCCDDQINNDGDGETDCEDPDCASLPVCEDQCAAIEPVEESPLPVQSPSNVITSTTINGHNDDYVFNQAGNRKLGIRRDWGGSIVFFGMDSGAAGVNATNTVDGNDTGREVQIALYDHDRWYQGCAFNASCRTASTTCEKTMTYFGWNPVQGGNRCNNGSGIESVTADKGALTAVTRPLQWNPNWNRQDCSSAACGNSSVDMTRSDVELTQRVRFVRPDVVELSYTLTNLGNIDHAAAAHEFPTVYATFGKDGRPDLYRLFDSTSREITSGWSTDAHGFRHQNFNSPGGWASLQNRDADYGVALFYESGMGQFQAWNKLDNPTKFNNFRGLFSFPIPANGQVRARSYLILGSLAGVASEAAWLDANLPPFGSLDGPLADATVSGTVNVHGWAMDNKGVTQMHMIIDGGTPVPLTYGNHRPDVCRVWPGYPACSSGNVGYQGSFDANAFSANECGHVLEIRATDTHGNQRIIARRRFYRAP